MDTTNTSLFLLEYTEAVCVKESELHILWNLKVNKKSLFIYHEGPCGAWLHSLPTSNCNQLPVHQCDTFINIQTNKIDARQWKMLIREKPILYTVVYGRIAPTSTPK